MLTASILTLPASFSQISASAWLALGYVSLFSMLIGFIFWYKGLAAGGIAAVGSYSCTAIHWADAIGYAPA